MATTDSLSICLQPKFIRFVCDAVVARNAPHFGFLSTEWLTFTAITHYNIWNALTRLVCYLCSGIQIERLSSLSLERIFVVASIRRSPRLDGIEIWTIFCLCFWFFISVGRGQSSNFNWYWKIVNAPYAHKTFDAFDCSIFIFVWQTEWRNHFCILQIIIMYMLVIWNSIQLQWMSKKCSSFYTLRAARPFHILNDCCNRRTTGKITKCEWCA